MHRKIISKKNQFGKFFFNERNILKYLFLAETEIINIIMDVNLA